MGTNNPFSGLPSHHESFGFVAHNGTTPMLDMFNRMPVVSPTTVFQTHAIHTPQYEIMDYLSTGTGTVVHEPTEAIITLSANNSGGRAVRQSREYMYYQPGKLQSSFFTFNPRYSGTFDNSVSIRVGLFDDYRDKSAESNKTSMGHFFELSGNSWFIVERTNSTDNVTNVTRIPQKNWNVDTLNGDRSTNSSGYLLSSDKCLIGFINRQWLGVGAVRMGFVINGRAIVCHLFSHIKIQTPYTQNSRLPIRWEIEKVAGGSSQSATLASICASSQVLGEYTPLGFITSLPLSATLSPQQVDTTLRPIFILRLRQAFCRATLKLKTITFYGSAAGGYTIFKNATVAGGSFTYTTHPDSRSMTEYKSFSGGTTSAFTVSGGIAIDSGFFDNKASVSNVFDPVELTSMHSFCSNIAGNPDTLVIAVCSLTGTADIRVAVQWMEIT